MTGTDLMDWAGWLLLAVAAAWITATTITLTLLSAAVWAGQHRTRRAERLARDDAYRDAAYLAWLEREMGEWRSGFPYDQTAERGDA